MKSQNGLLLCSLIHYFVLLLNLIYINISTGVSRVHKCLHIRYISIQCMILLACDQLAFVSLRTFKLTTNRGEN
jgi:hypothetical protein